MRVPNGSNRGSDEHLAARIEPPTTLLVQGGGHPAPVHRLIGRLAAILPDTAVVTVDREHPLSPLSDPLPGKGRHEIHPGKTGVSRVGHRKRATRKALHDNGPLPARYGSVSSRAEPRNCGSKPLKGSAGPECCARDLPSQAVCVVASRRTGTEGLWWFCGRTKGGVARWRLSRWSGS